MIPFSLMICRLLITPKMTIRMMKKRKSRTMIMTANLNKNMIR
nr:unnamed protein product [Callosobruchus analis]